MTQATLDMAKFRECGWNRARLEQVVARYEADGGEHPEELREAIRKRIDVSED